jgi:hypothetical protein
MRIAHALCLLISTFLLLLTFHIILWSLKMAMSYTNAARSDASRCATAGGVQCRPDLLMAPMQTVRIRVAPVGK